MSESIEAGESRPCSDSAGQSSRFSVSSDCASEGNVDSENETKEIMNQEINIWEELKHCQEQLQIMREKMALDELWKSVIDHYLLSQFGYDVQKVLRAHSSNARTWTGSPVDSEKDSNSNSNTQSPSNISQAHEVREGQGQRRSGGPSDYTVITVSPQLEFSSLKRKRSKWTNEPDDDEPDQEGSRSLSKLFKSEENNSSNASMDMDSSTWSRIPTFPFSDATVAVKSEAPEDQDDPQGEGEGYESTAEVSFKQVEDQIAEVIAPGKRGKLYECKICSKSLTQKQNARLHVRRVHFGERLKCSGCGRSFYDRRSIVNHKSTCTKYNQWAESGSGSGPGSGLGSSLPSPFQIGALKVENENEMTKEDFEYFQRDGFTVPRKIDMGNAMLGTPPAATNSNNESALVEPALNSPQDSEEGTDVFFSPEKLVMVEMKTDLFRSAERENQDQETDRNQREF